MFKILYNLLLGFYLFLSLPKLLYQRIRYRKYRNILPQKLGLIDISDINRSKKPIFWFHAVSLGESKVGLTFLKELKEKYPDAYVIFTTLTKTGYNEIKEDESVDKTFYMPFDFSWIMKRLLRKIKPDFVFVVETDFWFNFLNEAKSFAKVFLINGKLSERSFKRLKILKFFAKKLFKLFDHLCVQNIEYFDRFEQIGICKSKISTTGNVKYDFLIKPITDIDSFRDKYNISLNDKVITLASTHDPEERLILEILKPFLNEWKILLAPRHPERLNAVERLVDNENIILVKEMGVLPFCFSISKLAIIGGSFSGDIGGHNIIEPCLYNIPVIFGPHMHNQKDFVYLAMKYQLGYQVPISGIPRKIQEIDSTHFSKDEFLTHLKDLKEEIEGSSLKTLNVITPLMR